MQAHASSCKLNITRTKHIKVHFPIDPCEKWPINYFRTHDQPNKTLIEEMYEYGRNNLAHVNVMVKSSYITKIRRGVAMTFTNYVANAGGLIGLCIGFSFISCIEIIFWLCTQTLISYHLKLKSSHVQMTT